MATFCADCGQPVDPKALHSCAAQARANREAAAERAGKRRSPTALKTGTVRVLATCPHCRYNLVPVEEQLTDAGYDNGHDQGRGGYPLQCESCGARFAIEQDTVNDIQHVALALLGEA